MSQSEAIQPVLCEAVYGATDAKLSRMLLPEKGSAYLPDMWRTSAKFVLSAAAHGMSRTNWPRVIRRTRYWTPRLRFLSAIGRIPHGTLHGYVVGCPCEACRAANTAKQREKRGGPCAA